MTKTEVYQTMLDLIKEDKLFETEEGKWVFWADGKRLYCLCGILDVLGGIHNIRAEIEDEIYAEVKKLGGIVFMGRINKEGHAIRRAFLERRIRELTDPLTMEV